MTSEAAVVLTKNQKKKRRQKLAKVHKKQLPEPQETQANPDLDSPLHPLAVDSPRKRHKSGAYPLPHLTTHQTPLALYSVPRVHTGEPGQPFAPCHSLTTVDLGGGAGPHLNPAAAPVSINQHLYWPETEPHDPAAPHIDQQQEDLLDMTSNKLASVCRQDLSHAALLIDSHLHWIQQPHQPSNPAQDATATVQEPGHVSLGVDGGQGLQLQPTNPTNIQGFSGWPQHHPTALNALPTPEPAASGGSIAGHHTASCYIDAIPTSNTAPAPLEAAEWHYASTTAIGNNTKHHMSSPVGGVVTRSAHTGSKVFIHGNYHRYYGYRPIDEDPRLSVFDRRWFAGKRCMDVGCNEGLITLAIAGRFGPASMVGMDIDEQLIRKACTNLKQERAKAETRAEAARRGGIDSSERKSARLGLSALTHTWFVHGDFLHGDCRDGSLDMLSALSVTKWVHLHGGDTGIKAMFTKVHSLLAPGGLFLVEPQPWKSYKNASSKLRKEHAVPAGSYFDRLDDLNLRPEQFPEYLCDELGFRLVKRMNVGEGEGGGNGFDRPMYLFRKS